MKELVKELLEAPMCCGELREIAEQWLDAQGTDKEAEATEKFIAELKEDVLPVDVVIEFFASPEAANSFEPEQLKFFQKHMQELKESGAKYCDCPACAAGQKILDKFGALE